MADSVATAALRETECREVIKSQHSANEVFLPLFRSSVDVRGWNCLEETRCA